MHGRAGVQKAAVADLHEAIGEDRREEPAEKLHGVAVGGAAARTATFTVGAGDGAVLEADDALVGEGAPAHLGSEIGEGGGSVVMGPTTDLPGHSPARWGAVLQEAGVVPGFFEERTGDRGEGFDGAKEGGAGGSPGRAVFCEATARHHGRDGRMVLALPAPRMQDIRDTRASSADETLVFGEPFQGCRRGVEPGVGREALMGAEEGAEGCRHGASEQAVRPGQRFPEVVGEPLRGCMRLTLRAMPIAPGMLDAVVSPTAGALREAGAVMAAWALLDSADDLAVRGGTVGSARTVCGRKGGQDIPPCRHGRSPGMRAWRRS